ncbi:MAG: MoaD/ThiS family protein [Acidimicrobiales bacterium]|nr:MoaD/ThiS family protein [Acidimicrobiales bacterium]
MARLRLFAQAREAAGNGRIDVPDGTVSSVLQFATQTFGEQFGEVVAASQIWVNGEPADPATAVGPNDEVAVLPPVSGG